MNEQQLQEQERDQLAQAILTDDVETAEKLSHVRFRKLPTEDDE